MGAHLSEALNSFTGRIASRERKDLGALSLACLLLSSLLIAGPNNTFAVTSEDVLVITDTTISTTPKVVVTDDGLKTFVIWQAEGEIYIIKTTEGGASFSNVTNISNSSAEASNNPQITVSGSDNVLVVWEEAGDIFLARSIDAGDNFAVTNASNDTEASTNPQIAVSESDEVYIVWEGQTDNDDSEIFLIKTTTDGGASFGNATNISNSTAEASTNPQIAVSGSDNVLVVWEQAGDILIAVSTDGGAGFDIDNLSQSPDEDSTEADIHSVGGDVLATWQEYDTDTSLYRLVYKASSDNGQTFAEDTTILITADSPFITPSIALGTGGFFVIWEQFDSAVSEGSIFVSMANEDLVLSCPAEIGDTNDDSAYPQLASNGTGNLFSVWEELVEEGEGEKIIFASGVDATAPYITQIVTGNFPTFWGMDSYALTASGIVGNFDEDDSIIVSWGDGQNSTIPIGNITFCSWSSEPHIFGPEGIGTVEIVSSLIDSASNVTKDVSESFHADVLPHDTELVLHQVPSIQVGNNITTTGTLKDLKLDGIVEGAEITFDGTGADFGLGGTSGITDAEGNFTATGSGPDDPMTRLKLQAHFAGTQAYSASDSEVRLFNAAALNASGFDVTSTGSNVLVELTDFNATVQFEEIIEGGQVFVEECESSDTGRFLSLEGGVCLVISPALQLADGSSSVVTLSYNGQGIADEFSIDDIDIFLEDTDLASSYLDISQSRDTSQEAVSGQTTTFGKFILGLAIHESAPENALRKQAFVDENIEIPLRDIAYSENVNATISLDKSSFKLTDTATITIEDKNADLDPTEVDSVSASVQSESDTDGIIVPLTETGDDSGTFTGTFTFTSGGSSGTTMEASVGDELSVTYNQTNGARFKAVLHEVIESGVLDVYDVTVDPESTPFSPLGYAVAIELVDTQLSSTDEEVTVTLSYGNADLAGSDENYIRMFQGIGPGGGVINQWIIISEVDSDTDFTIGLDTVNKTVTADAELFGSAAIFVLGFEEDSFGDDGGGLGSTEPQEVLADAIASIRSSSSGGGGGGGGSGGGSSSSGSSGALPGSTGSTTAELSQSISPETSSAVYFDVPGLDQNLQIDFAKITSEGTVTVKVMEISQLPIAIERTNAKTIGDVYDIEPSSDLIFDGLVYVTVPYDETMILNNNSSENDVRALHFDTNNGWEDKTVSIDTVNNTVTAALSSFSPILVAIMEDGTFGSAYIEANPLSSISASNLTAFAMQEGQFQGVVVGQPVDIRTTINNMERNSRSYTYIVQILDKDGLVVSLDLADTGLLARSQEKQVTSSGWTPEEAGGYTVMVFIWEQNLQSNGIPTPLAPRLVMQDLTVIEAS